MNDKIDRTKIKYAIFIALYSGMGSYFGQPLIHNNDQAINIIVTVFSILAGFLVAVITVIGNPSSLPSGGWQRARLGSETVYNKLTRHKLLFLMYLTTLLLIFISVLVKGKSHFIQPWIERGFLFFAIVAFSISFQLPSSLVSLHKERIEQEIESRRESEKVKNESQNQPN
jgi:hypothetical protein